MDDLDLLADPLVLLSDAQVAVLAVCRTLAFDVETIVLQRPFGSMDGDIRRRLQELVEEESNRRHVVVE